MTDPDWELPATSRGYRWWIALVTFENDGDHLLLLGEDCQGAVGWLTIIARNEDQAAEKLRSSLANVGYRVIEIDKISTINSIDEVEEIDQHLAENTVELEVGKSVVFGTIHLYLADGEA